MKWLFRPTLVVLGACACLCFTGCLPTAQSQLDEEKEPHFLRGKSCVASLDYKGAIESFDKALQVNPRSASAHFELAWLYEQKEGDPAAAIYHYERYLRLRPNEPRAEQARGHIITCKQQLATSVSFGPVSERLQREFDHLTQTNKRLTEELEQWRVAYTNLARAQQAGQASTSAPPRTFVGTNLPQPQLIGGAPTNRSRTTPPTANRTYTVKSGDTAVQIARNYGVKLEDLLAANPRIDTRRLLPGQTLVIPARR